LANRNQSLERENNLLETRINVQNSQMIDLHKEVARLQQKESDFRDIILNSAGTQKVSEDEVTRAFQDIRQTVQRIASSPTFNLKAIPSRFEIPASFNSWDTNKQEVRHFYAKCRLLKSKDVEYRVKAQIFHVLYQDIFQQPLFGLKQQNYEGERNSLYWDIERHLVSFENMISRDPKGMHC
jgi:hypothetical protein